VLQPPRSIGRKHHILEAKAGLVTEAHHNNPLPMLRHKVAGINDPGFQRIAQLILQLPLDHIESAAFVVALQVLDVLKKERCRTVVFQDAQHIKEERALCLVGKSVSAT